MLTKTNRTKAAAVSLTLGLALLATACGSDDDKKADAGETTDIAAYCEDLKAAAPDLAGFADPAGSPDFSRFSNLVSEVDGLATSAPANRAADWKTLNDPLTELNAALVAANTDILAAIGSATTGKLPEGVTAEQMTEIGKHLGTLSSPAVKEVGLNMATYAKDDCGIDFASSAK